MRNGWCGDPGITLKEHMMVTLDKTKNWGNKCDLEINPQKPELFTFNKNTFSE